MVRAELLALVTTTATKVAVATALLGLLLTQLVFVTLLPALARGDVGPGPEVLGDDLAGVDLASPALQLDALSPLGASMGGGSLGVAVLALTLLGVLAATGDARYGGLVAAALAVPRRGRLTAAKAAAVALAALPVGAALVAVSAVTLLVTLALTGTPVEVAPLTALGVAARGTVAAVCLVLLGLAVGTLARNQVAGVLVMLAVLVGEPVVASVAQLVTGAAPAWTQALPLALTHAATGAGPAPWSPGVALAVLLALTGAALVAAAAVLRRRDL